MRMRQKVVCDWQNGGYTHPIEIVGKKEHRTKE